MGDLRLGASQLKLRGAKTSHFGYQETPRCQHSASKYQKDEALNARNAAALHERKMDSADM